MAVLGATSLTGCNSIPGFIASGTKTTFEMATVPVSWTKDISKNQSTLRIVNGSVSPGGTQTFSSIFSPTFPTSVSSSSESSPGSTTSAPTTILCNSPSPIGTISIQPHTISISEINSHVHSYEFLGPAHQITPGGSPNSNTQSPADTGSTGGGASHTHTVSGDHFHFSTSSSHSHPTNSSAHLHTFTATQDFGITYADIIVATKD